MKSPKLATDLKLDIDSKNSDVSPLCKPKQIQLYRPSLALTLPDEVGHVARKTRVAE